MAEPFYGVGQTPGLPEIDPSEAARKKAIFDYFMKEQGENFGAIPRALGAAFSMPQAPAPPKPDGYIEPTDPQWGQKIAAQHRIAAGGSEPLQATGEAPPSAYGRTSELDAIENEYNRKVEHPDLGFAWGGGPIKPYGQGSSARSGEFGQAPTQGAGFGQTWDVPAKGGAFSQSDIEQIPMGQRPASWFEDQMAGTDLAKMAAEKARAEAEAEDPYMKERIAAEGKIREHAFESQEGERRGQEFMDYMAQLSVIKGQLLERLNKRADLDAIAKEQERAKIEEAISTKQRAAEMVFLGKEPRAGF